MRCGGKVYYDLAEEREKRGADELGRTHIIRLDQLFPLHTDELQQLLAPYGDDTEVIWVQEEPWNMGAWDFIRARLPEIMQNRFDLPCIARPESSSPATGSSATYELE